MWKYKGNDTKPGNSLWDEHVEVDRDGNETGRSSLNTITPQKVSTFDSCEHLYEYSNNGNDAVCKYCGLGQKIVLGLHKIIDGKVITITP